MKHNNSQGGVDPDHSEGDFKMQATSLTSVETDASSQPLATKNHSRRSLFGFFNKRKSSRHDMGSLSGQIQFAESKQQHLGLDAQSLLPAKSSSVVSVATTKTMRDGSKQKITRKAWRPPVALETIFPCEETADEQAEGTPAQEDISATKEAINKPQDLDFIIPATVTVEEVPPAQGQVHSADSPAPVSQDLPNAPFDPPTPIFKTKGSSPRRRKSTRCLASERAERPDIDLMQLKGGSSAAAEVLNNLKPPVRKTVPKIERSPVVAVKASIPRVITVGAETWNQAAQQKRVQQLSQKAKSLVAIGIDGSQDWMHDLSRLEAEVAKLRAEVNAKCSKKAPESVEKERIDDGSLSSLENDEVSFAIDKARLLQNNRVVNGPL